MPGPARILSPDCRRRAPAEPLPGKNDDVSNILPFIFVLGVLVFVHELGHFLLARWHGVRVLTFSLGFGPKLFKFTRGDTEYCVSIIPLGGYVKMAGETPEDDTPPQARRVLRQVEVAAVPDLHRRSGHERRRGVPDHDRRLPVWRQRAVLPAQPGRGRPRARGVVGGRRRASRSAIGVTRIAGNDTPTWADYEKAMLLARRPRDRGRPRPPGRRPHAPLHPGPDREVPRRRPGRAADAAHAGRQGLRR